MPKLGDFIGALLSDAVHARMRADLEALKIAELYSAHELLKHLPVPRFRLPDISVEFPVIIAAVEGTPTARDARLFDQPTSNELKEVVSRVLGESDIRLSRADSDKVSAAAVQRGKRLFESGPQFLLSPAKVSGDLAAEVVRAVKAALKTQEAEDGKLKGLESTIKGSLQSLLLMKLVQSPYLQVIVSSGEIKSHGDNDSVVRLRLTITEDAYEVINRDEGQGYYLTPE